MPIDARELPSSYHSQVPDKAAKTGTGDVEFGVRLRMARQAKGLSQEGLAELIGSTQPRIAEFETGEAMPGAKVMLKRLAAGVEETTDYLLTGIRGMPREVETTIEQIFAALPKRALRKLKELDEDVREQLTRDVAALIDAKIPTRSRRARGSKRS